MAVHVIIVIRAAINPFTGKTVNFLPEKKNSNDAFRKVSCELSSHQVQEVILNPNPYAGGQEHSGIFVPGQSYKICLESQIFILYKIISQNSGA